MAMSRFHARACHVLALVVLFLAASSVSATGRRRQDSLGSLFREVAKLEGDVAGLHPHIALPTRTDGEALRSPHRANLEARDVEEEEEQYEWAKATTCTQKKHKDLVDCYRYTWNYVVDKTSFTNYIIEPYKHFDNNLQLTAEWYWDHVGYGAYVFIQNQKLKAFIPFANLESANVEIPPFTIRLPVKQREDSGVFLYDSGSLKVEQKTDCGIQPVDMSSSILNDIDLLTTLAEESEGLNWIPFYVYLRARFIKGMDQAEAMKDRDEALKLAEEAWKTCGQFEAASDKDMWFREELWPAYKRLHLKLLDQATEKDNSVGKSHKLAMPNHWLFSDCIVWYREHKFLDGEHYLTLYYQLLGEVLTNYGEKLTETYSFFWNLFDQPVMSKIRNERYVAGRFPKDESLVDTVGSRPKFSTHVVGGVTRADGSTKDIAVPYADAIEIAFQHLFSNQERDWYYHKKLENDITPTGENFGKWLKKKDVLFFRGRNNFCDTESAEWNVRIEVVKQLSQVEANGYDFEIDVGFHAASTTTILHACGKRGSTSDDPRRFSLGVTDDLTVRDKSNLRSTAEVEGPTGGFWGLMRRHENEDGKQYGSCEAGDGNQICKPQGMEAQSSFKYILSIDGFVTPWRLPFEFRYGSLIFLVESDYDSWFYSRMKPCALKWKHFWDEEMGEMRDTEAVLDAWRTDIGYDCISSKFEQQDLGGNSWRPLEIYPDSPELGHLHVHPSSPMYINVERENLGYLGQMVNWFASAKKNIDRRRVAHMVSTEDWQRVKLAVKMAQNAQTFAEILLSAPSITNDFYKIIEEKLRSLDRVIPGVAPVSSVRPKPIDGPGPLEIALEEEDVADFLRDSRVWNKYDLEKNEIIFQQLTIVQQWNHVFAKIQEVAGDLNDYYDLYSKGVVKFLVKSHGGIGSRGSQLKIRNYEYLSAYFKHGAKEEAELRDIDIDAEETTTETSIMRAKAKKKSMVISPGASFKRSSFTKGQLKLRSGALPSAICRIMPQEQQSSILCSA